MRHIVTRKFGFRIRTRAGLIVDNLQIPGRDAVEAERKVQQLYRDCVILENYGCAAIGIAAGQIFGSGNPQFG